MKNIGIIPLRLGSKGIPFKNRKSLLGRPLFSWVLGEAIFSDLNRVYVFTDDTWIKDYININYPWSNKVEVIDRSQESATDTASTELALLELANHLSFDFDTLTLLQATSPLTTQENINASLELIGKGCDSTVSVVKTHRFIWSKDGRSLNYDYLKRPRRQAFEGTLIENGAIYTTRKEILQKAKNRLGGKIGTLEMDEDTLIEIDSTTDFTIIEALLVDKLKVLFKNPSKINMMVFDVDGVLTDATVAYGDQGEALKSFNFTDGMGFDLLKSTGIKPVVITSEQSPLVAQRMKKLRIEEFYPGAKDKYALLNHLCIKNHISRNEIAYMGDDINDMANICASGWGICPANAVPEMRACADLLLHNSGGKGAAREAVEFIINWNARYI